MSGLVGMTLTRNELLLLKHKAWEEWHRYASIPDASSQSAEWERIAEKLEDLLAPTQPCEKRLLGDGATMKTQWTVEEVLTTLSDANAGKLSPGGGRLVRLSPSGSYQPEEWWPKKGQHLTLVKDDECGAVVESSTAEDPEPEPAPDPTAAAS